jgi:ATP-dependent protease ClpP protease subunit
MDVRTTPRAVEGEGSIATNSGEQQVDVALLLRPQIRLHGMLDDDMLTGFFQQMDEALKVDGPIVVELTTSGGSPDIGLRIAEQVRLIRTYLHRDLIFSGVTTVYSAGMVVMSGFPNTARYLARNTRLLIHGRRMDAQEVPAGPLTEVLKALKAKTAEFENGVEVELEDYRNLIAGSAVSEAEIRKRAETNWYLSAREAKRLGLVAGLF